MRIVSCFRTLFHCAEIKQSVLFPEILHCYLAGALWGQREQEHTNSTNSVGNSTKGSVLETFEQIFLAKLLCFCQVLS